MLLDIPDGLGDFDNQRITQTLFSKFAQRNRQQPNQFQHHDCGCSNKKRPVQRKLARVIELVHRPNSRAQQPIHDS